MTQFLQKVVKLRQEAIFKRKVFRVHCFFFKLERIESLRVVRKLSSFLCNLNHRSINGDFLGLCKFLPLQTPGLRTEVRFLTPQPENWRWCSRRLLNMGSGCFTSGKETLEEDRSLQYGFVFIKAWSFALSFLYFILILCFCGMTLYFAHLKFMIG